MGGFLYLLPVEKSGRVCERFRRSGCGDGVCLSKAPLLSDETSGGGFPLVLGGSSGGVRGGRSGLFKSLLELLDAFCSDDGFGGIGGYGPWSEWTRVVGEGEDGSLPILLELR